MNKLLIRSLAGTTLVLTTLLSPAKAETVDNSDPLLPTQESILEPIQRQYSNLKNIFNSLGRDFNRGVQSLSGEIEAQINNTVQDLGLPDMLATGRKIEETIANSKADILQLDPRIKGKNARIRWNQKFTLDQSETVLGEVGQKAAMQEKENAQKALEISATSADAAQNDFVTQDVMKKIALQNAQISRVLKSVQSSIQQQNEISATTNVNLTDISKNLTNQQRKEQRERQGAINAIYKNAAFSNGFWSSKNK